MLQWEFCMFVDIEFAFLHTEVHILKSAFLHILMDSWRSTSPNVAWMLVWCHFFEISTLLLFCDLSVLLSSWWGPQPGSPSLLKGARRRLSEWVFGEVWEWLQLAPGTDGHIQPSGIQITLQEKQPHKNHHVTGGTREKTSSLNLRAWSVCSPEDPRFF